MSQTVIFQASEDTRMVADSVARFLGSRVPFEARQAMVDQGVDSHAENWAQLCEIGASLVLFKSEEGGHGGAGSDIGALFEVLGPTLTFEPLLSSLVAGKTLVGADGHGTVLQGLVEGSLRAGLAYEEANSFYDPAAVECRASRSANGWTLQGRKIAVPIGKSADHMVVSARCDTAGTPGISLFLLTRESVAAGMETRRAIDGGVVSTLNLEGVQVPAQALIGQAGLGLERLRHGLMYGTFAVCAEVVGLLQQASVLTLDYLRTRKQFGTTIGSAQVLQHRYVDMMIKVEEAISAVTNAAAALDRDDASAERAVSAAKASLTAIAVDVAQECIHMHGGIGLTRELPLAQMARRLVMTEHVFGDADFHLGRYAELGRPSIGRSQ
ncbi:acyl-CoA dehydrogenase family protein [Pseudorhodoferax soli]|uniref:Acyl-CoA dehydrogenase/oxidase C-terminal domain-containing protein n=1 Tax=Pseudorhodoferax soli TaxID=545864 RepID=A0A368XL52_9BURK|nr:acyl-CoA dehydrogenase [Pseudorhodoferax soli]RCW68640.1 hypothetical protein DES41_107161 [Pseudorhodoferax soli]